MSSFTRAAALPQRRLEAGPLVIALAIALVAAAVVTDTSPSNVAVLTTLLVTVSVWHRQFLQWQTMLATFVVIVLLVPVGRYTLPTALPFELEPYRLLFAILAALWLIALLIQPDVSLRHSPLDAPVAALLFVIVAATISNAGDIQELDVEADVLKALTFFGSFLMIYVMCTSLLRTHRHIDAVIRAIVVSGLLVACLSIYEYWSGENYFLRISEVFPALNYRADFGVVPIERSGRLRVVGASQHPIEFAAVSIMLIPLAFYLWKTTGLLRWFLAGGAILIGSLSTISRTGVVMFIVAAIVFFVFRPAETKRLLPLAVPALVAVYLVLPNALGSFYAAFFPEGGIVEEQSRIETNDLLATGRLGDLGPWWEEYREKPLLGRGLGTRVYGVRAETEGSQIRARLLDNQWLGTALELGAIGVFVAAWLFIRTIRRLGRAARADSTPRGWLPVALLASIAAYAVGMFTYDAFGFVQVTLVLFVLLGLAGAVLVNRDEASAAEAPQSRSVGVA